MSSIQPPDESSQIGGKENIQKKEVQKESPLSQMLQFL